MSAPSLVVLHSCGRKTGWSADLDERDRRYFPPKQGGPSRFRDPSPRDEWVEMEPDARRHVVSRFVHPTPAAPLHRGLGQPAGPDDGSPIRHALAWSVRPSVVHRVRASVTTWCGPRLAYFRA